MRTRIAPTPSGYLHIGNAYSFVLTALIAKHESASVLLRIDDLDRARYRKKYVEDIFRTLEFLEINWDEGPRNLHDFEKNWSQKTRFPLYRQALETLRENDNLFACTCSRKEVARTSRDGGYAGTCRGKSVSEKEKSAWRIKTKEEKLSLRLWPKGHENNVLPVEMRDFVVRRKDGIPAYQLASVVDDLHFDINLVVRGADLYDSSLAQLFIAKRLNAEAFLKTRFFHHPLLRNADGEKLSKSKGSRSIAHYIQSGGKLAELYREIGKMMGMDEEVGSLAEMEKYIKMNGFPSASIIPGA